MTADLRPGVRRNVNVSKWIAGIAGGLGGIAGTGILINAAAAAALGVVGGVAVAGVIGGASLLGYRWLYRSTLDKARGEMLRALESITAAMRAEDVFGAPITAPPPSLASSRSPDA